MCYAIRQLRWLFGCYVAFFFYLVVIVDNQPGQLNSVVHFRQHIQLLILGSTFWVPHLVHFYPGVLDFFRPLSHCCVGGRGSDPCPCTCFTKSTTSTLVVMIGQNVLPQINNPEKVRVNKTPALLYREKCLLAPVRPLSCRFCVARATQNRQPPPQLLRLGSTCYTKSTTTSNVLGSVSYTIWGQARFFDHGSGYVLLSC